MILQITEIVICPEVVVTLLKSFPEHSLCLPAAAKSLVADCLSIVGCGIGYPVIGHTWEIDRLRSCGIYPNYRCGRRSQRTYDLRPRSHQGRHSCNRRNKPLCDRINEQIIISHRTDTPSPSDIFHRGEGLCSGSGPGSGSQGSGLSRGAFRRISR